MNRIFLTAAATLFGSLGGCANAAEIPSDIDRAFREAATAIVSRDIPKLYAMTHDPISFKSRSELEDTVETELYGPRAPISAILAEHDLRIIPMHVGSTDAMRVTWVIYIPGRYWAMYQANPDRFLATHYRKGYAACAFVRTPKGWKLKESLCFAESDDPFAADP